MIIILIAAVLLSTPTSPYLLQKTTTGAHFFHEKCLEALPKSTEQAESLRALLCGEKIQNIEHLNYLKRTSLIHIFIVSGSHLVLIDHLLEKIWMPFFVRILFLSVYSLCVGWQAPAVRALLGLGLKEVLRQTGLFFPPDLIVLLTGFLALFLFPDWWGSLSLGMSWCAALALCLPSILRIKSSLLKIIASQMAIYIFMLAPLWGLGALHPLSILYNIFIGPVVAFVLLPLGFLGTLIPPTLFIFDHVVTWFFKLLPMLSDPIDIKKQMAPPIATIWLWIFCWHIFFHYYRIYRWQGNDSQ